MERNIAWLLLFMGLLVLGHLGLIYVDLYACYDYYSFLRDTVGDLEAMANTECSSIEETYQAAVDKYLAVALALVTGGAAGAVVTRNRDDE